MVVAVEGGGTKTRAWLVKGDEVLTQRVTGPSNVQALGAAKVAAMLVATVDALVGEVGATRADVRALGLGLAGAGTRADRERVVQALEEAGARMPVAIESDAAMLLEGATRGAGGVVVIAGTGSIAIARSDGSEARAGGWGSALGDDGSGYALGRALLVAVTRELDERAGGTLALELMMHLGLDLIVGPEPWIREHAREPAAVAALAPLALKLAENGDQVARDIASAHAWALADFAAIAWAHVGLPAETAVVLHGGCLTGNEYYRGLVTAEIQERMPQARVALADPDDALRGCLLAARAAIPEEEAR
jgi:N-acetylglucosamine kinase-like BadF-type ATPase